MSVPDSRDPSPWASAHPSMQGTPEKHVPSRLENAGLQVIMLAFAIGVALLLLAVFGGLAWKVFSWAVTS